MTSNLALAKETFTFHFGKPSKSIAGLSPIVPSAKCVGGGSGVNSAVLTQNSSQAENYQCGSGRTHGVGGPISVSSENLVGVFGQQYLAIAAKYDKDRDFTEDPNDFNSCNKYGSIAMAEASASLHESHLPLKVLSEHNSNLQDCFTLSDKRAVGVGPCVVSGSTLSGSLWLAIILERSGIGASEVLQRNDIPQLVELPGMEENYNNHNLLFIPYYADESSDTLDDDIFHGNPTAIAFHTEQWHKDGTGLMASKLECLLFVPVLSAESFVWHSGIDAGIKIRPTWTCLHKQWNSFFLNARDKPVMWIGPASAYYVTDPPRQPGRKFFSIIYYTVNGLPDVHSRSNDNAERNILRLWAEYTFKLALIHTLLLTWRLAFSTSPIAVSAPGINYTEEDDSAIDEYHRLKG
ncbi:hypothetical protein DFS33DRAFT_1273960 [Desarmillaria ectypa]|nr:hypothetical protein DFS33DRAFT_1273960 [Desarmillaria ectypa]